MIHNIVKEINSSLESKNYLAALALVLTLPDICGKAEFTNENSSKKRYANWYDKHIGLPEFKNIEDNPNYFNGKVMPYINGEVIYSLRCSFLHQGSSTLDLDQIKKDEACKINKFEILVDEDKDSYGVDTASLSLDGTYRQYRLSLKSLCDTICYSACQYYDAHKEQFSFLNFNLVSMNDLWVRDNEFE